MDRRDSKNMWVRQRSSRLRRMRQTIGRALLYLQTCGVNCIMYSIKITNSWELTIIFFSHDSSLANESEVNWHGALSYHSAFIGETWDMTWVMSSALTHPRFEVSGFSMFCDLHWQTNVSEAFFFFGACFCHTFTSFCMWRGLIKWCLLPWSILLSS